MSIGNNPSHSHRVHVFGERARGMGQMAVEKVPQVWTQWHWRKRQRHGPNGSGESAKDMDPMALAKAPKRLAMAETPKGETEWSWRKRQRHGPNGSG